jgi:hypothetical protein
MHINNQRGFAAVFVILGLVAVVLAATLVMRSRPRNQPLPDTPPPTAPPSQANSDSGIGGNVYCSQKIDRHPCSAEIEVYPYVEYPSGSDEAIIAKVKTEPDGSFRINLRPGSYNLVPDRKAGYVQFLPPLANPVTVSAGQFARVEITYHDGTK